MNRLELLKKLENKPIDFTVEGFGDFKVKGMNTMDYLFAAAHSGVGESGEMKQESYFAALVTRCVMDKAGKRLFTDDDVTALTEADISFVLPLALKIQELSGVDKGTDELKKS